MWCIYWISVDDYDDPLSQGYVGITNDFNRRKRQHVKMANSKCHYNPYLQNAIDKCDVRFTMLYEGTEEECWKKEAFYRPEKYIGWNVERGGIKNPRNGFLGKTHTAEHKEYMRKKMTGRIIKRESVEKALATKKRNDSVVDNISKYNKLTVTCPHCNKTGGAPGMKRFHFDYCKDKT